ncbi:Myosin-2 essential light chain [Exaiptasia diaphana]|nr:Myosin-2 essential light chain [Exaiptasia diaphana]
MTDHLSDEQIAELQDAFSLFDLNGRGKVPAKKVKDILRAVGLNPMMDDIQKMEKDLGKESVSFDSFLTLYVAFDKKPKIGMEEFIEGLRAFDKDQDGTVSAAELRNILVSLGDTLTQEDADTIIALGDNHGSVEYEKLIKKD